MDFSKAVFLKSVGFAENLSDSFGKEIVFVGRSNAGKSSLINKLCGRTSLARVSSVPGKTVTVNFFSIGGGYHLADLPGYGYSKRSESEKKRWGTLMERFFNSGRDIKLVVLLLDIRHRPSDDDFIMLDFLAGVSLPFIAVLTKKDKLKKSELTPRLEYFSLLLEPYRPINITAFSVRDNADSGLLKERVEESLKGDL